MDLAKLEQKLGRKGRTIKIDENTVVAIVNENFNKLLKRLEIDVSMDHTYAGTPSRTIIKNAIAKIYEVPEDFIVVKSISTEYGVGVSKAHVHVYIDQDIMKKVELKHVLKRNNMQ